MKKTNKKIIFPAIWIDDSFVLGFNGRVFRKQYA